MCIAYYNILVALVKVAILYSPPGLKVDPDDVSQFFDAYVSTLDD